MAAPLKPPAPAPGASYLLYLHVPFCEELCPYCSFNRVRLEAGLAARYFEGLRAEMRAYAGLGYRFDAAYVGGGTPTVLPAELGSVLRLARELWPIRSLSVETNPNHLTPEILRLLADCGVDRLSVGVQSFDDGLLASLHRLHRYGSGARDPGPPGGGPWSLPHPERGHDLQPRWPEPGHAGARSGRAPGARAGADHLLPADEPARPAGILWPRAPLSTP